MNYKKLTNFYVFVLSVLIVNLASDKITSFILAMRVMSNPVKATASGMLMLVFILVPAFAFLQKWSDNTAKYIFKIGKNAGGKFIGVTLAFFFCLLVLFVFYLGDWYGRETVIKWMLSFIPSV